MHINTLVLRNFRNYTELKFAPDKGLNLIFGANAQGKTNLLESVFLCAFGRSHRTIHDSDMIQADSMGSGVTLNFLGETNNDITINVKMFPQQPKQILIDGIKPKRLGELMGCFKVVMFSPETLMLVKGAPAERRRFMDMGISQLGKAYFYKLQQYNLALRQRNTLLKNQTVNRDMSCLDAWDKQLALAGAYIMQARARFVNKIEPYLTEVHQALSQVRETLEVTYTPGFAMPQSVLNGNTAELTELLLKKLSASRTDDIRRGFTNVGPHKDDLTVKTDGVDAKTFASQGQQRTAALALKLSEIRLIEELCGERPVVLLDDVFSELDEERCNALLGSVSECQCLITCAQEAIVGTIDTEMDIALFHCEQGVLEDM